MIKVLELVYALYDGGAENIAREYASTLNEEKFNTAIVTVLNMKTTANYRRAMQASIKIRSVYKDSSVVSKIRFRLFGIRAVAKKIKRIIEEEKPDVIHIHSALLKYFVPISEELKGIALFYTCHSNPSSFFAGKNSLEKPAAEFLIKNNGLRLVALHDKMRVELNEMFGVDNTVAVKNGVNFKIFNPNAESRMCARKELGIPDDEFVIGHIGRFAKVKNHSFLIDVFNEVCKRKTNASMILVGNGPLQSEIKEKIESLGLTEKVKILSNRTDTAELLNAMDVFVFPSFYEGLPVTLVEAQATGLRCVVSDRINPESFLTEKTIPTNIDEPAEKWAAIVLDDSATTGTYGDLSAFDINKEIKKLELIYKKNYQ